MVTHRVTLSVDGYICKILNMSLTNRLHYYMRVIENNNNKMLDSYSPLSCNKLMRLYQ